MPQVLATRRKARLRVRGEPPPLAIGTPGARFAPERRMVPHGALECPDILRRIVRVNQKLPLGSLDLFEGGADEFLVCPVDELDAALCVGYPHRRRATDRKSVVEGKSVDLG